MNGSLWCSVADLGSFRISSSLSCLGSLQDLPKNPAPSVDGYLSRRNLLRRQLSRFRPPLHSYVSFQKAPLSQSSCPSPPVKLDLLELVFKHHSTARSQSSCYRKIVSLRFVTSSSVLLRLTDGSLSPEQPPLPDPPDPPDPPDFSEIPQLISPYIKVIVHPTPPCDPVPLYESRSTKVVDMGSPASAMAFGSTNGVAPGVSKSREPSSTVRSNQSSSMYVHLQLLSPIVWCRELEYQPEHYLSNSVIRTLLVSLQDICVDMSVLIRRLAVLKPPSLRYTALRSLEDWTLGVGALVVDCFVITVLLHVYNSETSHGLVPDSRVHLAQLLTSVSVCGVHLAQSLSQLQEKSKDVNTVLVLRQDQVRLAPRNHSNTAWNKDKLTARLRWIFSTPQISGQPLDSLIHGSMGQSFMGSPFIAGATAMRSARYMALTLSSRRVFSNNSTLTRAISGNLQFKEVIGIVFKDIRSISSGFASISFFHLLIREHDCWYYSQYGSSNDLFFVMDF